MRETDSGQAPERIIQKLRKADCAKARQRGTLPKYDNDLHHPSIGLDVNAMSGSKNPRKIR